MNEQTELSEESFISYDKFQLVLLKANIELLQRLNHLIELLEKQNEHYKI